MTTSINYYYKNIIIYDLIQKLNLKNIFQIPRITKINLNITCKQQNIKKNKLIYILFFLNILTNKKPCLTKPKLTLKIKQNKITGCKITLRKQSIFLFLEKLIFFILPDQKNLIFNKNITNIFNFKIVNLMNFIEFKNEFFKFKELSFLILNVSIHTNCKTNKQLHLLLNYFFLIKLRK